MAERITDETMEYVEILAKLELTEEERAQAKADMSRMLDYIDQLNELDTSGVEPMTHIFPVNNVFREDEEKDEWSREEILDLVWGRDYFGELKIVDVNIRRLRLKIEDNAQNPTYINTVWGYGYKWGF